MFFKCQLLCISTSFRVYPRAGRNSFFAVFRLFSSFQPLHLFTAEKKKEIVKKCVFNDCSKLIDSQTKVNGLRVTELQSYKVTDTQGYSVY